MAKKKKGRKRRPAPGRPPSAGPSRPVEQAEDGGSTRDERRMAARERREAEQRRRLARRRRRQARNIGVVVLALAIITGLVVFRTARSREAERKANRIAAVAGCTPARAVGSTDRTHLQNGQTTTYDVSPPTGGPHDPTPLTAGVYDKPFSTAPVGSAEATIFRAVHSMEHGYVIVWYKGLSGAQLDAITKAFERERKVIIVPYPELKDGYKVALTVWHRLEECKQPNVKAIGSFITRFREKTAPEPQVP